MHGQVRPDGILQQRINADKADIIANIYPGLIHVNLRLILIHLHHRSQQNIRPILNIPRPREFLR